MKGTAVRLVGALALVAAAGLVLPPRVGALASPFVPVWDAAYRDLDVLLATGGMVGREAAGSGVTAGPEATVAGSPIRGQRPYSRMVFARAVEEVRFAAELALLRGGESAGEGPAFRHSGAP
jgi:hypothetical protein